MYTFAMVAESKKWFERSGFELIGAVRDMLVASLQDQKAFNEWYKKLAPQDTLLKGMVNMVFGSDTDAEKIRKLIAEELQKGILEDPHYIKTLHTYKDLLLQSLDASLREMSEHMFNKLKQQGIAKKKEELRRDKAEIDEKLQQRHRAAFYEAMQCLAPANAMKVTILKMTKRFTGNYHFFCRLEVEGSPKLYCTLQHPGLRRSSLNSLWLVMKTWTCRWKRPLQTFCWMSRARMMCNCSGPCLRTAFSGSLLAIFQAVEKG